MADVQLTKTASEINAVGTVVSATSTVPEMPNSSWTTLAQISLTKGVWVITAQMRIAGAADFFCQMSISTTAGDYTVGDTGWAVFNAYNYLAQVACTTSRIVAPTATTTYYLTGWQRSGGTKAVNATGNVIKAVRIK